MELFYNKLKCKTCIRTTANQKTIYLWDMVCLKIKLCKRTNATSFDSVEIEKILVYIVYAFESFS